MSITHFPVVKDLAAIDCGPGCLQMILAHHRRAVGLPYLRWLTRQNGNGTSMLGLSRAAEFFGLRTLTVRIPSQKLLDEAPLPCILHLPSISFFVVLVEQAPRGIWLANPCTGLDLYRKATVDKYFLIPGTAEGIAMFVEDP